MSRGDSQRIADMLEVCSELVEVVSGSCSRTSTSAPIRTWSGSTRPTRFRPSLWRCRPEVVPRPA